MVNFSWSSWISQVSGKLVLLKELYKLEFLIPYKQHQQQCQQTEKHTKSIARQA